MTTLGYLPLSDRGRLLVAVDDTGALHVLPECREGEEWVRCPDGGVVIPREQVPRLRGLLSKTR